jgi:small subunit ribosomal protein S27Ae|tara:strand:- start:651 stop:848 length:198 start_codon:yes stop_codon:yes gene_type:complete
MAKKGDKKGKKPHKNKLTSKKYLKYSLENGKAKSQPHCPRCGPGIFLAINEGRVHCGKCHYTEFK